MPINSICANFSAILVSFCTDNHSRNLSSRRARTWIIYISHAFPHWCPGMVGNVPMKSSVCWKAVGLLRNDIPIYVEIKIKKLIGFNNCHAWQGIKGFDFGANNFTLYSVLTLCFFCKANLQSLHTQMSYEIWHCFPYPSSLHAIYPLFNAGYITTKHLCYCSGLALWRYDTALWQVSLLWRHDMNRCLFSVCVRTCEQRLVTPRLNNAYWGWSQAVYRSALEHIIYQHLQWKCQHRRYCTWTGT